MPLPPPTVVNSESRLATLARYGILDTAAEPAFDDIAALARVICDAPVALVSFVEVDRQWFKARSGVDLCETPLEQSVCAHAITQGSMLIIPDLTKDERTRDNTLVTGEPFVRFYAGAPLEAPNGEMLGSLCVLDYAARPAGLAPKQMEGLQVLAYQVVHLLDMRVSLGVRDEALEHERQSSRVNLDRAVKSERVSDLLRRESHRSRVAQEAGQIGIFEIDTQTNLMRVSSEFCRIFGLPVRATYPASELEALVIPEDQAVASNETTGRNKSAEARVEYRIRRANDGAVRWVARRAELHERTDDRPLGDKLREAKTVKDTPPSVRKL